MVNRKYEIEYQVAREVGPKTETGTWKESKNLIPI